MSIMISTNKNHTTTVNSKPITNQMTFVMFRSYPSDSIASVVLGTLLLVSSVGFRVDSLPVSWLGDVGDSRLTDVSSEWLVVSSVVSVVSSALTSVDLF